MVKGGGSRATGDNGLGEVEVRLPAPHLRRILVIHRRLCACAGALAFSFDPVRQTVTPPSAARLHCLANTFVYYRGGHQWPTTSVSGFCLSRQEITAYSPLPVEAAKPLVSMAAYIAGVVSYHCGSAMIPQLTLRIRKR